MTDRTLVTIAALLLLAGCTGTTEFDNVSVFVVVHPTTVAGNDTVDIQVGVVNVTDRSVTLSFDSDCQFLFRILNGNGLPVAPAGPWFCTQGQTAIVLPPRGDADTIYRWVAQVSPGTYHVYGYVGENRVREAGPVLLPVQ